MFSNSEVTSRIRERAIDEFRRYLIMFVYLWILFGLFVLNEKIILGQRGISFASHGFALVNALVLAKVMLVTEDLKLSSWIGRRPLAVVILCESLLLTALFILFHVGERIVAGLIHQQKLADSIPEIGEGGLAGVLCVSVILFVTLIPFFGFRNLSREIGHGRMKAILFGSATADGDG